MREGITRKNVVQTPDGSLKRLGMEYVDLLWVHAWDMITPAGAVVDALGLSVAAWRPLAGGAVR